MILLQGSLAQQLFESKNMMENLQSSTMLIKALDLESTQLKETLMDRDNKIRELTSEITREKEVKSTISQANQNITSALLTKENLIQGNLKVRMNIKT